MTKNFNYSIKATSTLLGVCMMAIFLILPLLLFIATLINRPPPPFPVLIFFLYVAVLMTFVCVEIALYINHYRTAKDQILTIARGVQQFRFGHIGTARTYDKKDIREIVSTAHKKAWMASKERR